MHVHMHTHVHMPSARLCAQHARARERRIDLRESRQQGRRRRLGVRRSVDGVGRVVLESRSRQKLRAAGHRNHVLAAGEQY